MGFFERAKRRVAYFLLDYLHIKEAAADWSARYQQSAPTSLSGMAERHTEGLLDADLDAALKANEQAKKKTPTTQGTALNVDLDVLDRPGAFASWYHHGRVVETMEHPAISKKGNEKPRRQ